jgi:ankyrin repeat protein
MTVFDLIASRDADRLAAAIAADPNAAASRNAEGASALAFAAYSGNADAIALLRAAQPTIDPYEAIILGERKAVEAALAGGWDGNAKSPDGFTPLSLAAFFGRHDIFDRLLPLTRDVNERATNTQQVAALHAAAAVRSVPLVERLLRAGADPNLPQQQGFVALHTAAMHGDALLAGLLLLFGADLTLLDASGRSAAARARESGHDWLADRLDRASAAAARAK